MSFIDAVNKALDHLNNYGIVHPNLDQKSLEYICSIQSLILNRNDNNIDEKFDCPICIIGGGISGQYAAYMLTKLGFSNVTILEKEEQLNGGRCSSLFLNGIHCPAGAMRIPKEKYIEDLFEHLLIQLEPFCNHSPNSLILSLDDSGNASVFRKSDVNEENILSPLTYDKFEREVQYVKSFYDRGVARMQTITELELDKYSLKV